MGAPVLRSSAISRPSIVPTNSLSPQSATPRLTTLQQALTARSPGTLGSKVHSDLPVAASHALTLDQAWVTYNTPSTPTGVASCPRAPSMSAYLARPSPPTFLPFN